MKKKLSPRPILGYTDVETVKLDLDNISFKHAKYCASRIYSWFKLGGFVILKSSVNCYHVVFDRSVSWNMNVKIMAWACLVSKHRGLTGWFILQCIKQGSTLRVSPKKEKPAPRIVYRGGIQTGEIKNFLRYRKMLKTIMMKS